MKKESTIPTAKDISKEIKWLRENKEKIRRRTAFGDDNWEKIDAQIDVMTEDLSEDEIYSREINDESGDGEWNQDVVSNALEARHWMDGEEKESPSEGWKSLVKP